MLGFYLDRLYPNADGSVAGQEMVARLARPA